MVDLVGGNIYRLEFGWREVLAHVGDGVSSLGVFRSLIFLSNNQDQEATGELRFYGSDGTPREVTVGEVTAAVFPFVLPPRSSRSFSTAGLSDPLFSGWARVVSSRRITGSVLYRLSSFEQIIAEAGVIGSVEGEKLTGPVTRGSALDTNTAFAIANPSTQDTAEVQVIIKDSEGAEVADLNLTLGPLQHLALFIDEIGSLPADFEGTLYLTSSREIAATLLLTLHQIHSASLPLSN